MDQFSAPASLDCVKSQLESFLEIPTRGNDKIVLITSGGTSVPFEKSTVRSIENFSTGRRGAISAEQFLKRGYYVVYLHRDTCFLPFIRTAKDCFKLPLQSSDVLPCTTDGTCSLSAHFTSKITKSMTEFFSFKDKLLFVPYTTLSQYIHFLFAITTCLNRFKKNAIVYLAAAVSDYFIPDSEIPTHKIQSSSSEYCLTLKPVPKMVQDLVETWIPYAYVVTFKLETDPDLLDRKAVGALKKYNHQAVVGNILSNRYKFVKIFTQYDARSVSLSDDEISLGLDIETKIVEQLCVYHDNFIAKEL